MDPHIQAVKYQVHFYFEREHYGWEQWDIVLLARPFFSLGLFDFATIILRVSQFSLCSHTGYFLS